jgi:hypothetical protein
VKPRNREVNIFNMSVLDLLTGALGAFCFLTLALFPSYYKMQKSSAPDQREQSGKIKHGIPPFSLAEIFTADDKGNPCGVLRSDAFHGPHGDKSFRQLPMPLPAGSSAEGYKHLVYLFMFDPGTYNLTVMAKMAKMTNASSPNASCYIYSNQYTPQGPLGRAALLSNSPKPYVFILEVKPEQFITSILPHR